jgi:hypothetical protein
MTENSVESWQKTSAFWLGENGPIERTTGQTCRLDTAEAQTGERKVQFTGVPTLALKVQECLQLCQHELHAHGRHDKLHETGNHSLHAATETRPQPNSKEQGRRDFCYTVHGNASKFRGIPPRPTLIWRKVPDWGTDMLFVFGCDLAATIGAF